MKVETFNGLNRSNPSLFPHRCTCSQDTLDNILSVMSKLLKGLPARGVLAGLCVMYNETGGTFDFTVRELGSLSYLFNINRSRNKASYNLFPGNKTLTQIARMTNQPLTSQQAAEGNGDTLTSSLSQLPISFLKACDFYVYRGSGIIQTTGRSAIRGMLANIYPNLPELATADQIDECFKNIKTFEAAVRYQIQNAGPSVASKIANGDVAAFPYAVSGYGAKVPYGGGLIDYSVLALSRADAILKTNQPVDTFKDVLEPRPVSSSNNPSDFIANSSDFTSPHLFLDL